MFGIGFTELLVLGLIIAILIGPKQLPYVMRMLANFAKSLQQAKSEFEDSINKDETLRTIRNTVSQTKRMVDGKVVSFKSAVEAEVKALDVPPEAPKDPGHG